jgi:uncharacterized membrane protein HdeD (DUF308 family)
VNDQISLNEASQAMRSALQETVRKNANLFLVQAVLMVVAGLAAFGFPLMTSVALAVILGWLLLFSGIAQIVTIIGATHVPHFWPQLISAALAAIIGLLFVRSPGMAVNTLALLMIVYFMVEGVAKIVFSLSIRPLGHWGWVLASGIVGVLIGAYLMSNPALSLVLLGFLIGAQLVSEGVAIGMMAWRARKA